MDAKEFLLQYKRARANLDCLEVKRDAIRDRILSLQAVQYDGINVAGGSINPDRIGEQLAKYEGILITCDHAEDHLRETMTEVSDMIDGITDSRCKKILYFRYIQLMRWETIADELNYDLRWVHRLHGKALNMVRKQLRKKAIKSHVRSVL